MCASGSCGSSGNGAVQAFDCLVKVAEPAKRRSLVEPCPRRLRQQLNGSIAGCNAFLVTPQIKQTLSQPKINLSLLGRKGQELLEARHSLFDAAQRLQGKPFLLPDTPRPAQLPFHDRDALQRFLVPT